MNYYNCIYMYVNKINGKRYIGQTKVALAFPLVATTKEK